MKNTSIRDWAAIAEIIGTIAVIISLVFVVRSIDQNTKAIEATEANNIWEAWREVGLLPVINNLEFAAVYAKVNSSENLSAAEQMQWNSYQAAQFDIWAQLYDLYNDGLIAQDKWDYWDDGYWRLWEQNRYSETWARLSLGANYDPDFQQYVNSTRAEMGLGEH